VEQNADMRPLWFTKEVDSGGWTMLHVAAENSSSRIARMLFAVRADSFGLSAASYDKNFVRRL
jgi:hypothetical protein